MSLPDSANQPAGSTTPAVRKQSLNVYTVMLIISFIAICVGCVLLYLELQRFGSYPWWDVDEAKPATSQLQPAPMHATPLPILRA